jgi:hypothetical protein
MLWRFCLRLNSHIGLKTCQRHSWIKLQPAHMQWTIRFAAFVPQSKFPAFMTLEFFSNKAESTIWAQRALVLRKHLLGDEHHGYAAIR